MASSITTSIEANTNAVSDALNRNTRAINKTNRSIADIPYDIAYHLEYGICIDGLTSKTGDYCGGVETSFKKLPLLDGQ